jgi:hypothetical protein
MMFSVFLRSLLPASGGLPGQVTGSRRLLMKYYIHRIDDVNNGPEEFFFFFFQICAICAITADKTASLFFLSSSESI